MTKYFPSHDAKIKNNNKATNSNEQVSRTGVSLSFRRRQKRLLSRTWLCDAPPKGSQLDG